MDSSINNEVVEDKSDKVGEEKGVSEEQKKTLEETIREDKRNERKKRLNSIFIFVTVWNAIFWIIITALDFIMEMDGIKYIYEDDRAIKFWIFIILFPIVTWGIYFFREGKICDKLNIGDGKSLRKILPIWLLENTVICIVIAILTRNDIWIVKQYGTTMENQNNGIEYVLAYIDMVVLALAFILVVFMFKFINRNITDKKHYFENFRDTEFGFLKAVGNLLMNIIGIGLTGGAVYGLFIAWLIIGLSAVPFPNSNRDIKNYMMERYKFDIKREEIQKVSYNKREYIYSKKDKPNDKIIIYQEIRREGWFSKNWIIEYNPVKTEK